MTFDELQCLRVQTHKCVNCGREFPDSLFRQRGEPFVLVVRCPNPDCKPIKDQR